MSARVDAHLHLWRRSRGDYGWLTPAAGVLWRDFEPRDAQVELAANAIEAAVLVQAAPTEAETRFLLEVATTHDWVAGVVGWIDLDAPDATAALERLASDPGLVGIRPMLQDLRDPLWITAPSRQHGLKRCAELGLSFDALVRPAQLAGIGQVADEHPQLRIVVDHGGKPPVAQGDLGSWRADLRSLAERPNIWCKLSGLVTEAGDTPNDRVFEAVIDALLELFGPTRLIWGSDWPVCTTAISYSGWCALTERLAASLSSDETAALRGDNARRFYRLEGIRSCLAA